MTDDTLQVLARRAPGFKPTIAVVLGSGWSGLTEHLESPIRVPYEDLPDFPVAGVPGHGGELWLGTLGQHSVAVMSGRKHGYEGGPLDAMHVPLKALHAMGCQVLVQTNAAGSLRAHLTPHSLMLVSDHINLPQRSPLVGQSGAPCFVDMVNAYDPKLLLQAQQLAQELGVSLQTGIYLWAFGPQFETPAEIRMMALLGADAVGMSTVPETILARYLGMRVLALSMMTNMGAGLSNEHLSHAHTLTQAAVAGKTASSLLAHIIGNLKVD